MALPLSGLTIDTCVVALQLLRVSAEAALREVSAAAQPAPEVTPEEIKEEPAPDGQ
jgi:hypothetical protein